VSKKSTISPEELALFHQAMHDVKPLAHKKQKVKLATSKHKQITIETKDDESFPFKETFDLLPVDKEDLISYKQIGVPDKTLRKLRKGKYNVDAILDLHGLSVEKAKVAIQDFLLECIHREIEVALIIHGKGRHSEIPILKNKLNQWLRGIDLILAFCSAASSQGNRGAVYVLLKRKKEELLK
jgi:DNA-nicking Smr family endonuclease